MSFFSELKRRNVFKVAVAYAVVAWLILQLFSVLLPAFSAPAWVTPVLFSIIIAGLPFALLFAWAFELTPEGIKPTGEVVAAESINNLTGKRINYFVSIGLALALVLVILDSYVLNDVSTVSNTISANSSVDSSGNSAVMSTQELVLDNAPLENEKTIAVLPFVDLSPNGDQEHISDGLTEEILNKLAQVRDLQVTARTSSFYFKGKNESMRTIGETLDVTYLLEGSVRKSGNQLRISAKLIKAEDDYQLFSKTYDRELADVFDIQDEIAGAVTTALSITIGVGEFSQAGSTNDIDAYEEYLQARSLFVEYTGTSILAAIDHAQQAVRIDPNYGNGWSILSRIYIAGLILLPPEQAVNFEAMAASALEQANIIAPDNSWVLQGIADTQELEGNWLDADQIFGQLLDQYGNSNADAILGYGRMLLRAGRSVEAIPVLQRAHRLDPLSEDANLALAYLSLDRVPEALVEARRGQTLNGFQSVFNVIEWVAALYQDDRSRAATIIKAYYSIEGENPDQDMLKFAQLLEDNDTESALAEIRNWARSSSISPIFNIRLMHGAAALGDPELALESYLNISSSTQAPVSLWYKHLSGMRQLPAFKTLVSDLGLVDYWRETGNWSDFCRPVGENDFECE